MGEPVPRAELEQALAAQPGAAEAGGTALVPGRMGVRPEVRHLQMRGDAVPREPGGQRHMALRIETGVEMDGHDLETEGHDALPDVQGLEQHEAVHPAGNGHADAAAGPDHACPLHGLAGALDADLLRIGAFFAHMSSCPAGHVLCCSGRRAGQGRFSAPPALTAARKTNSITRLGRQRVLPLLRRARCCRVRRHSFLHSARCLAGKPEELWPALPWKIARNA